MTGSVSRLLLSLCMVPLAIVFGIVGADTFTSKAGILCSLLVVYAYWIWVWWGAAWGTARRRRLTVYAGLGSLLVGGLVSRVWGSVLVTMDAEGEVFGVLFASFAWTIATAVGWRETKAERIDRLRDACASVYADILLCGNCGYHMAGLTHARCPECGTEYTLDALMAVNAERVGLAKDPTAGLGR